MFLAVVVLQLFLFMTCLVSNVHWFGYFSCVICLVCVCRRGEGGRRGGGGAGMCVCVCSTASSTATAATAVLEHGKFFLAVPVGSGTDDCCAAGSGDDAYCVAGVCLSPLGLYGCCSCC